jgi:shikimate kinase
MRIYFIGYMASGKSCLGQKAATSLGYSFADLDALFEERFRISVSDFFEKYGEDRFRKIEQELLYSTLQLENTLISTGGGTPCFFDNMDLISRSGISVYLQWTPDTLSGRLSQIKMKRPLLKDLTRPQLEQKVKKQLTEREHWYKRADIIFEPEKETFDALILRLKSRITG